MVGVGLELGLEGLWAIQYAIQRGLENTLSVEGVKANIEVNPRCRRKPKYGRPYRLDRKAYKSMRSAVERFLAWIKASRRITMRWERLASTFLGFIQVARTLIYLRILQ